MHPRSIAARNDTARQVIRNAANAIADRLGIAPLAEVTPVEWRTPGVGAMRELEHIAALLNCAAVALLPKEESNHAG